MVGALNKIGDPQLKLLRALFKQGNKFMMLMWRLGLGRYCNSPYWGYIMVLTTTGHKSGLKRYAPVNFDQQNGVVYCLPAWGKKTHWYRNLEADPHCEVWLPDGWWAGVAEPVTDPDERLRILRRLLVRSGFAARLFEGIDAATLSDDELRKLGERYEAVVRIRLVAERSGPGGPGDLAWVWSALGIGLLMLVVLARLSRRRRSR